MTELHLHIDGSIRPKTAYELASAMDIIPKDTGYAAFCDKIVTPGGGDLNAYLDRFSIPLRLVKDRTALKRMTEELVRDLADEGETHAELRFAPHFSEGAGLTQRDACDAVLDGVNAGMRARPGIDIGIILCCMRGAEERANTETVRLASEYKGSRIRAVDLAGAEALYPTHSYHNLFRMARDAGVPYTIHAGEADGPESVRAAIEAGARRIGHGVRAIEDPSLVRELASKAITLEVCPTSNIQTGICDSYASHPIRRLFDAGVRVTLSSDNRTVSGTTLTEEIDKVKCYLHFTDEEISKMAAWAHEALFT